MAPAHVTKGLCVMVCDYIYVGFVRVCLLAAVIANVRDHVSAFFVCFHV